MRYFFLFLVVIAGIFNVPIAIASSIKVESDFRNFQVGDVFSIDVTIDTAGQILNAVEIDLVFPTEFLQYLDYDDGSSMVNLWVERPNLTSANLIHLSGVTPGGFSGNNESLLSLSFKVIKTGQGVIEISKADLLKHDGFGTADKVTVQNIHITSTAGESSILVAIVDDEIPESFTPQIINDPDLFSAASTLIFSTKDKGSGLDRFEVKEGFFSRYTVVMSPYQLKQQSLTKKIYIKAVDKKGNIRVEIIYPQNGQPWHELLPLILSILGLCVLTFFASRKLSRSLLRK